jgi:hypothetical protein
VDLEVAVLRKGDGEGRRGMGPGLRTTQQSPMKEMQMAINLMAPKGNEENVKLSNEIWKKLNEMKKAKEQQEKKDK